MLKWVLLLAVIIAGLLALKAALSMIGIVGIIAALGYCIYQFAFKSKKNKEE